MKLAIISIFIVLAVIMIGTMGFTEDGIKDIAMLGFILILGWLRFKKSRVETAMARSWIEANSKCERCGETLSYHRNPKKSGQLLLGGLTCKNCGAEYNVSLDRLMPK